MPYTQHTILRNTSASSNESIPDFPAPPKQTATMQTDERTPERSPEKRVAGITQTQKQALVDNLQLEVTERARKLRAQYALQAQGMRARLEMRVNRIPSALRKRNMQDLVEEHSAKSRPAPPAPMPIAAKSQLAAAAPLTKTTAKQHLKRQSNEISTGDDKENVPSEQQDIANPKKRTKTATVTANTKATRTRNAGPAGVLSPRSHNSRNLPQSPIKPAGGLSEKGPATRPMTGVQAVVTRITRAPSRQTKRPGTAQESEGRASEGSTTSAGTTIVTKPGTRKAAVPKKTAPAKSVAGRKAAATKVEPAAATRTLRKRN
ncbi:hypothetical protein AC579_7336 [Pseudocercospora musae]|uniref:Borealin N-terminal domain-containing protein n=1 Tax=Pseudocercospora musae TaxID=113226 RepID=A0A139ICZ2_9PEZI|nr:hypothetical protein AC579_7336 [Pseudocercospora musae]